MRGPQLHGLLANLEFYDVVRSKLTTIELLNTFAGMGFSDCDVDPGHKRLADWEYCDIVLRKFTTIGFVNICACLGLSDTSLWPTGSAMTSS